MGWSLRRSFKLGPTRLNLSSRGIGTSIGVRGFRLGVSGSGRTYVRGGRGMLRYEKTLGSRSLASPSSTTPTAPTAQGCLGAILFLAAIPVVIVGAATLVAVFDAIPAIAPHSVFWALGTLAAIGFSLLWLLCRHNRARVRRQQEEQAAREQEERKRQAAIDGLRASVDALSRNASPSEAEVRRVASLRETLPLDTADLETAYRAAVADVIRDQTVTPQETHRLGLLATAFGLAPDAVERANLGGFVDAFYALISDGKLTEEEDEKLARLPAALGVPEDKIQPYLAKAAQLRRAREVKNTPELIPLATDVRLKKDENCLYSTPATEFRFCADGDERPTKFGTLYATTQRLLFLGNGTRTIKYDSLLRMAIAPKRTGEALSLTIESRKEPLYLDVPEPFVLAAYIERLAAQAT